MGCVWSDQQEVGSPAALTSPCVTWDGGCGSSQPIAKCDARVREENESSDGAKERKMGRRARWLGLQNEGLLLETRK